jgi:hypothetical protein
MQITTQDITRGYELIKECIDFVIKRNNIQYIASPLAPNTYKGMRNYRDDMGHFLVYDGGDHGLLGEEYNIKFRALHDAMHYENELTFKFEDELTLSEMTSIEFSNIVVKLGYSYRDSILVSKIVEAEIGGQIEYYKKHKEYVPDQTKFIYQYLGAI